MNDYGIFHFVILISGKNDVYLQIRNTVNGANVSAYFKSPTL